MLNKKNKKTEVDLLSEQELALKEEMRRLEQYIQGGAEKERAEQINTMPAPDELESHRREADFIEQVLSRKEIKNVRRHQTRGLLLFILLAIAILTLGAWAYKLYMSH